MFIHPAAIAGITRILRCTRSLRKLSSPPNSDLMKILLLGGGGREHAFAWKMTSEPLCEQLYVAPGNAGTAQIATNCSVDPLDFGAIAQFVEREGIGMIVVGPEAPLVAGIVDYFQVEMPDLLVVGPDKLAAQLEGSKSFGKQFMAGQSIPTAAYQEFTAEQVEAGVEYLTTLQAPYVLKADGLAGGKGVLILEDLREAQAELRSMLSGKFGAASSKVVVEEFLSGIEFSVFVLTDGTNYRILPVAKDYKRIGEGDTGLNTGGMGAVSPVPVVTVEVMERVAAEIIEPTIRGIQEAGMHYRGFVFLGLILTEEGPKVIEYNCRMGDPETEVVLPRLQSGLTDLLIQTARGELGPGTVDIDPRAAVTVMLVSGGYPGSYERDKPMRGFELLENCIPFHAGTKATGNNTVTSGGRVLALTSYGDDLREALEVAKRNAERIEFEGRYFRRDIGFEFV